MISVNVDGSQDVKIMISLDGAQYIADVMAEEHRRTADFGALEISEAIYSGLAEELWDWEEDKW